MSAHTPAPWKVDSLGGSSTIVISTANDVGIAQIIQYIPHIDRANATLIAAAPELLDAANDAQCACSPKERDSGHLIGCWMPALSAAIARAEGKS